MKKLAATLVLLAILAGIVVYDFEKPRARVVTVEEHPTHVSITSTPEPIDTSTYTVPSINYTPHKFEPIEFELDDFESYEYESYEYEPLPSDHFEGEKTEMVYVSRTGSKYHDNPNCSGMVDPEYMSKTAAINLGREPCENCY